MHAHGFDDDQIYRRGLRVTTTIDASAAGGGAGGGAAGHRPDTDMEAGLASVAPGTGDILADYGGRDYLRHQYDNAFLASLPPGSSFDPFVLATALHDGIGLRSTFDASPLGSVVNDDDAKAASADLLTATARVVQHGVRPAGRRVGASAAAKAGLPGRLPPHDRQRVDQAAAYAALASGTYAAPHILAKVSDRSGKVLLDVRPQTRPAFSVRGPRRCHVRAPERGEDGRGLAARDRPVAGKYGTTDHNAAAWFCGYTPDTATAVVVYRASNRPLVNVGDAPHRSGTVVPTRIWRAFMTSAEAGRPGTVFPPPAFDGATLNFARPPADPVVPARPRSHVRPTPTPTLPPRKPSLPRKTSPKGTG